MFGKFQRRNNRKARLSSWFARERGSDLHAFDLQDIGSKVGAYLSAVMKARAVRRSGRPADEA